MALLDNMYSPYSQLMQRFTSSAVSEIHHDPSITRLDINVQNNSSNESSPTTVHSNSRVNGHYGGSVMTMPLKFDPSQTNLRAFAAAAAHSEAQENNINEDNRKEKVNI